MAAREVFLIRHGETEWSLNGRHTGVSDIPLTDKGREVARLWQPYAAARVFALVLCSPLQRARQTCELAGLGSQAQIELRLAGYRPMREVERNPELERVLELIAAGSFSRGDREVFRPLLDNLRNSDPFLVLADYAAYVACQERVNAAWRDEDHWTRMSILNTARSGKFSSDRAVREYCDNIWNTKSVRVALEPRLS